MTARCLALRAHLRENEQLADLPPAAVQLWGRHFAYAGVMGVARTAVALLPFGTEDDNGAWSRFGGRWRRVHVRYPRGWPPGWGKHPAFATFLAVLWGAAAVAALYGLRPRAVGRGPDHGDRSPLQPRPARLDRSRCAPADDPRRARPAVVDLPAGARRARLLAHPDDHGRAGAGTASEQIFQSSNRNNPRYWYYLALDDGTRPRIRSWRVRRDIYDAHAQGETVGALYTANLGYVRALRPPSGAPAT